MEIEVLRGGICAVSGVRAYGIRENNRGLALIEGKGKAVGMFTMNKMKAAPLIFTQRLLLENGRISAIIANSGCANSFTGEEGMRNANRMAELASAVLGVDKSEVAVASTGPIGKQLDIAMIARQVQEVAKRLTSDPEGSAAAAKAIMTTDTFPKELAIKVGEVTIGGIAKGSGMIYPHLATATMLAFIYTDAELDRETMRTCLKDACDNSFNMIVVDGDMSTNDMVLLVSRGGKEISAENFKTGLNYLCKELAKMIARDGEGATKFIEVNVSLKGAPVSQGDAKLIAREILRSPLVKSAIFGERIDLACGRIIAAIGSCSSTSTSTVPEVEVISMKFRGKEQEVEVVRNGRIVGRWNHEVMKGKEITIDIVLGGGEGESEGEKETTATATAWGCDLSCDYVMLNASML